MNWLEELKAGSQVIVERYPDDCLTEIERTTKTQLIIGNMRFRKSDGGLVGGSAWCRTRLLEPVAGKVIGCLQKRAIREIGAKCLDHLDLGTLEKIIKLIG